MDLKEGKTFKFLVVSELFIPKGRNVQNSTRCSALNGTAVQPVPERAGWRCGRTSGGRGLASGGAEKGDRCA